MTVLTRIRASRPGTLSATSQLRPPRRRCPAAIREGGDGNQRRLIVYLFGRAVLAGRRPLERRPQSQPQAGAF